MNTVYVVVGSAQVYFSGEDVWHVAAYPDREAAELHARLANEAINANAGMEWRGEEQRRFLDAFPFDHAARFGCGGTEYYVVEVPLVPHISEYMDLPRPPQGEGQPMSVTPFSKGDKVVVRGLDVAFVFDSYYGDGTAKLFLEGQTIERIHLLIRARVDVLLPNNKETLVAEGW